MSLERWGKTQLAQTIILEVIAQFQIESFRPTEILNFYRPPKSITSSLLILIITVYWNYIYFYKHKVRTPIPIHQYYTADAFIVLTVFLDLYFTISLSKNTRLLLSKNNNGQNFTRPIEIFSVARRFNLGLQSPICGYVYKRKIVKFGRL